MNQLDIPAFETGLQPFQIFIAVGHAAVNAVQPSCAIKKTPVTDVAYVPRRRAEGQSGQRVQRSGTMPGRRRRLAEELAVVGGELAEVPEAMVEGDLGD